MIEENPKTVLSLETYGNKATFELPYSDISVEDVLKGLVGLMVAHTWLPESIYRGMKRLAEENLCEEEDEQ